jgi:hypothetical protein
VPFAVSVLERDLWSEQRSTEHIQYRDQSNREDSANRINAGHHQMIVALAAIRNTIAEIEGGLITSLRAVVAGEVSGVVVGLGKEILDDDTEAAERVSAVLIAVAFEDIIRRMGTELAGVPGR